jgi:dUTP pyrophosphatase
MSADPLTQLLGIQLPPTGGAAGAVPVPVATGAASVPVATEAAPLPVAPPAGGEPAGADPAAADDAPVDQQLQATGVGNPATFRCVIETTPASQEFYHKSWPLGYVGEEGFGNLKFDSGIDIPMPEDVDFAPGEIKVVDLGVRVRGLQLFWNMGCTYPASVPSAFALVPRSSISKPGVRALILTNSPGTVDVGYNGPLKACLMNLGNTPLRIPRGTAVVQVVAPTLAPIEYMSGPRESAVAQRAFPETMRGEGGFGSTGAAGSAAAPPPPQ